MTVCLRPADNMDRLHKAWMQGSHAHLLLAISDCNKAGQPFPAWVMQALVSNTVKAAQGLAVVDVLPGRDGGRHKRAHRVLSDYIAWSDQDDLVSNHGKTNGGPVRSDNAARIAASYAADNDADWTIEGAVDYADAGVEAIRKAVLRHKKRLQNTEADIAICYRANDALRVLGNLM